MCFIFFQNQVAEKLICRKVPESIAVRAMFTDWKKLKMDFFTERIEHVAVFVRFAYTLFMCSTCLEFWPESSFASHKSNGPGAFAKAAINYLQTTKNNFNGRFKNLRKS